MNQTITIPETLAHFSGEEGQLRRQAISHAINRQEIVDTIFGGTRTVAVDFTSPVVAGFNANGIAATPDGPRVAQVPVVWLDDDTLGLHVARGNGIARHLDDFLVRRAALAQGAQEKAPQSRMGLWIVSGREK